MKQDEATVILLEEIDLELARNAAEASRLQTRRRELEGVRAFLSARLSGERPQGANEANLAPGDLAGEQIAPAAIAVLRAAGPPGLSTKTLIKEMEVRGWKSRAEKTYSSVFGTLARESKRSGSAIAKADGIWKLTEWSKESK